MRVRIIYGKLKPGTWDAYEAAYKEAMDQAGHVPGLVARWLTRDVADPDGGYSISLWRDEAAMQAYESGDTLKNTILPKLTPYFSGDYTTTHCDMRHRERFE